MKIDCQRFYLLDGFTEKGYYFLFLLEKSNYQIIIANHKTGEDIWSSKLHPDADSAMSEALKWLRKQNKITWKNSQRKNARVTPIKRTTSIKKR